jgi:uncharacterized protein GlcG (DUF336 family)
VKLEQAFAIVRHVVDDAPEPVSVYVVDGAGEVVAAAATDGAAAETRAEAKRKALAVEVGAYDRHGRIGAVGVSGPADADARASAAIEAAGLQAAG